MLCKAEDLLPSNEMEYSSRYVFTIDCWRILTMLSKNELRAIIRCDSAWAGVHAAQLLANTLLNSCISELVQKACGSKGHRVPPHPPHLTLAFDIISMSSGQWFLPGSLNDLRANHWLEFGTILLARN